MSDKEPHKYRTFVVGNEMNKPHETHPTRENLEARIRELEGKEQHTASSHTPPFANCQYKLCDLPGQCLGEGACHHPITRATQPDQHTASLAVAGSGYAGPKRAITACACEFDAWKENPYTKVLQKSIDEDYVPKQNAEAVARHKIGEEWHDGSSPTPRTDTVDHNYQASCAGRPLPFPDEPSNPWLMCAKLERELAALESRHESDCATMAKQAARLDALDCRNREGGATTHCRHDSTCVTCSLAAANNRVDEAEKDAARYRWMRSCVGDSAKMMRLEAFDSPNTEQEFDVRIDEAMRNG